MSSGFPDFLHIFGKNFHPLQEREQGQAQNIAHQELRAAHAEGVEGEKTGEGGGKAAFILLSDITIS